MVLKSIYFVNIDNIFLDDVYWPIDLFCAFLGDDVPPTLGVHLSLPFPLAPASNSIAFIPPAFSKETGVCRCRLCVCVFCGVLFPSFSSTGAMVSRLALTHSFLSLSNSSNDVLNVRFCLDPLHLVRTSLLRIYVLVRMCVTFNSTHTHISCFSNRLCPSPTQSSC